MRILYIFLMAATLSVSLELSAQSDYEPDIVVLNNVMSYDVEADGSFLYQEDLELKFNTQAGVENWSQYPIPFSESLQELEILEAYTITADGERIDVGEDGIYTQQSPVSNRAPAFSDFKLQFVVFPGVEPGATIHLSFHRKQVKPLFPGEFSALIPFDVTQDYRSAQVTVTAPESYPLYIEAIDIKGGEIPSEIPGKKAWQWSIANTTPHVPEMGSVSMIDVSPRVVVSSFPDYEAISAAFLARTSDKATVTPKIQKLADKITRDIEDKREQAEALYAWVAENIRYVAIFIEYGGVVPRESETILNTRYGDCKDHVVLLQALLSAKGIESRQVLVNATNNYWLPTVASPDLYNHAITYIPEFDLFVDATLKFAPFGVLSPLEVGKKALITHPDSKQVQLATVPGGSGVLANLEEISTKIDFSSSGKALLNRSIESAGAFEFMARAQLAQMPKGREKQIVSAILKQMGQNASGDVDISDAHKINEPFAYSYKIKFPDYVSFDDPGTFSEPVGIPSLSGISNMAASLAMENRDFPVPCVGGTRKEKTVIHLPEDVSVTSLPPAKNINTELGQYRSNYTSDQQTITINRTLDLDLPPVCDSESYTKLRNMAVGIALDLKGKFSFQ